MSFTHHIVNLSILLVLSFSSIPTFADDDFDDELGDEDELADYYGDEDFISLATGSKQLIHKAPSVASVITADDIKKMGAVDIDDLLETVPGLHVSRIANGNQPVYTFRGIYSEFNAQVLMLVNGIPVTNMFVGNRSQVWGGMPVEAIERVEVIRGPGSAIYGAEAFAGVINIIIKNADSIDKNEFGGRIGSFDTKDFWLSYAGEIGNVKASMVLETHRTKGHEGVIDADAQTFLDSVFATNASLAPNAMNNKRDNLDLRLDFSLENWRFRTGLQRRKIGTGVGIAEALDPTSQQSSVRWNADLSYNNNSLGGDKNWGIGVLTSFFDTTQEIDNNFIIFPPGSDIGFGAPFPDGVIGNPEVFERHFRFNLTTSYRGIEQHGLVLGVGYNNSDLYKVKESKNFGLGPNGEFLPPGSDIIDVTDTPFVFTQEGDRKNTYFYLQDIWSLANDWELTAGIRNDHFTDFGSTTNPRLALVWSTTLNVTTKFLYGKAFRAPSVAEFRNINNPVALGNPNLRPEEIETLELAFDYHPHTGVRTGISIFLSDWTDIIQFVPDEGATSNTAQNVGEQKSYGLELEFDWDITDHFALMGNYSLQKSTDEVTDSDTPLVPQQQLYLRADWKFAADWNADLRINTVLERQRNPFDNRPDVDGYTLIDLTVRWMDSVGGWGAALIAKNILDDSVREPTPNINLPSDLPLAGRSMLAQVSYQF